MKSESVLVCDLGVGKAKADVQSMSDNAAAVITTFIITRPFLKNCERQKLQVFR
jgi:hypothetical protein